MNIFEFFKFLYNVPYGLIWYLMQLMLRYAVVMVLHIVLKKNCDLSPINRLHYTKRMYVGSLKIF